MIENFNQVVSKICLLLFYPFSFFDACLCLFACASVFLGDEGEKGSWEGLRGNLYFNLVLGYKVLRIIAIQ